MGEAMPRGAGTDCCKPFLQGFDAQSMVIPRGAAACKMTGGGDVKPSAIIMDLVVVFNCAYQRQSTDAATRQRATRSYPRFFLVD